jgi:hypothetical protein
MLVEFTVENFLSFKDSNTLSMVAGALKEFPEYTFSYQPARAARAKPIQLLKSVAIYGPNAGGKTNLVKAMEFMRKMVLHSSKDSQAGEGIPYTPFLLNPAAREAPCTMEVIFVHDHVRYRYGFSTDKDRVRYEWLFAAPKGREAKLFVREDHEFDFGKGWIKASGLEEKTRENALFLSVAAQFNQPVATQVLQWFSNLQVVMPEHDLPRRSIAFLEKAEQPERLFEFIRLADQSISRLGIDEVEYPVSDLPEFFRDIVLKEKGISSKEEQNVSMNKLVSHHHAYNDQGERVGQEKFDFSNESKGTRRLFYLAGLIFHALDHGSALVVDELECSLHPKLTRFIINIFHSKKANPKNAQLIFATHDLSLFSRRFFRRDQLWMVRKNDVGVSELYALSDFKVRADASYDKDYMQGRYGAVPVVNEALGIFGKKNGQG